MTIRTEDHLICHTTIEQLQQAGPLADFERPRASSFIKMRTRPFVGEEIHVYDSAWHTIHPDGTEREKDTVFVKIIQRHLQTKQPDLVFEVTSVRHEVGPPWDMEIGLKWIIGG